MKWLQDHISANADALFARLCREPNRRWQVIYAESQPGARGGLAIIPTDDSNPFGWCPVAGVFADGAYHLTRDQIATRLTTAARDLPILDPTEPFDGHRLGGA